MLHFPQGIPFACDGFSQHRALKSPQDAKRANRKQQGAQVGAPCLEVVCRPVLLPGRGNLPFLDQSVQAAVVFHRLDGCVEGFAQFAVAFTDTHTDTAADLLLPIKDDHAILTVERC